MCNKCHYIFNTFTLQTNMHAILLILIGPKINPLMQGCDRSFVRLFFTPTSLAASLVVTCKFKASVAENNTWLNKTKVDIPAGILVTCSNINEGLKISKVYFVQRSIPCNKDVTIQLLRKDKKVQKMLSWIKRKVMRKSYE